jgi:hypothetical protein
MADGLGAIVFAELHLFQRVVFAIGAALFVAAIIAHKIGVGSFGLGLIFPAVSWNLFFDFILNWNMEPTDEPNLERKLIKHRRERKGLVIHGGLSFLLAAYCFYASYSWAARGVLPYPFLQLWSVRGLCHRVICSI